MNRKTGLFGASGTPTATDNGPTTFIQRDIRMTTEPTEIRPMTFSRFAVERCIRILVDGNGHFLLPIDNRQDEALLDPIANDIGLGPANLSLIETQVNEQTFAMVVELSSDLGKLAWSEGAAECQVSRGDFGSVWWRVVGFEEGFTDEPFQLATTDCEESAHSTCMSLQALLKPLRVAVRLLDGDLNYTVSDRPAMVVVLNEDSDTEADDESEDDAPLSRGRSSTQSPWAGLKSISSHVTPDKIQGIWGQLEN
jgi:hypothetical protein